MRKLALERLRENYKVSEEIKGKYKNELKQLEKAHLLPFSVRLKNFFLTF